jgi:hypothetical protein
MKWWVRENQEFDLLSVSSMFLIVPLMFATLRLTMKENPSVLVTLTQSVSFGSDCEAR